MHRIAILEITEMASTNYRVKHGKQILGDCGSTKEVQDLLKSADPGEYPIDVVTRTDSESPGSARQWGKAVKHEDGMVHLESDLPGE